MARCLALGLLDHGRRQVDAGDVPGDLGQRTGDQAGAAGHVQHVVLGADAGHFDEEPVGLLVGVGGHLRERHRLPGELVQDQPPLFFRPVVHASLKWGLAGMPRPLGHFIDYACRLLWASFQSQEHPVKTAPIVRVWTTLICTATLLGTLAASARPEKAAPAREAKHFLIVAPTAFTTPSRSTSPTRRSCGRPSWFPSKTC